MNAQLRGVEVLRDRLAEVRGVPEVTAFRRDGVPALLEIGSELLPFRMQFGTNLGEEYGADRPRACNPLERLEHLPQILGEGR